MGIAESALWCGQRKASAVLDFRLCEIVVASLLTAVLMARLGEKIALDPGHPLQGRLRPGLSTEVTIHASGRSSDKNANAEGSQCEGSIEVTVALRPLGENYVGVLRGQRHYGKALVNPFIRIAIHEHVRHVAPEVARGLLPAEHFLQCFLGEKELDLVAEWCEVGKHRRYISLITLEGSLSSLSAMNFVCLR